MVVDYNYKNMCVWHGIFACPDVECIKCDGCEAYIPIESPEGKAVHEKYADDIRTATDPVREKWRRVMESERMMRKENHAQ